MGEPIPQSNKTANATLYEQQQKNAYKAGAAMYNQQQAEKQQQQLLMSRTKTTETPQGLVQTSKATGEKIGGVGTDKSMVQSFDQLQQRKYAPEQDTQPTQPQTQGQQQVQEYTEDQQDTISDLQKQRDEALSAAQEVKTSALKRFQQYEDKQKAQYEVLQNMLGENFSAVKSSIDKVQDETKRAVELTPEAMQAYKNAYMEFANDPEKLKQTINEISQNSATIFTEEIAGQDQMIREEEASAALSSTEEAALKSGTNVSPELLQNQATQQIEASVNQPGTPKSTVVKDEEGEVVEMKSNPYNFSIASVDTAQFSDPTLTSSDIIRNQLSLAYQIKEGQEALMQKKQENMMNMLKGEAQRINNRQQEYITRVTQRYESNADDLLASREAALNDFDAQKTELRAQKEETVADLQDKREKAEAYARAQLAFSSLPPTSKLGLSMLTTEVNKYDKLIADVGRGYTKDLSTVENAKNDLILDYSKQMVKLGNDLDDKTFDIMNEFDDKIAALQEKEYLLESEFDDQKFKLEVDFATKVNDAQNQAISQELEARKKAQEELIKNEQKKWDSLGVVWEQVNGEIVPMTDENGVPMLTWEAQQEAFKMEMEQRKFSLDVDKYGFEQQKFQVNYSLDREKQEFDNWYKSSQLGLEEMYKNAQINQMDYENAKSMLSMQKQEQDMKWAVEDRYGTIDPKVRKYQNYDVGDDGKIVWGQAVNRVNGKQCGGSTNDWLALKQYDSVYKDKESMSDSLYSKMDGSSFRVIGEGYSVGGKEFQGGAVPKAGGYFVMDLGSSKNKVTNANFTSGSYTGHVGVIDEVKYNDDGSLAGIYITDYNGEATKRETRRDKHWIPADPKDKEWRRIVGFGFAGAPTGAELVTAEDQQKALLETLPEATRAIVEGAEDFDALDKALSKNLAAPIRNNAIAAFYSKTKNTFNTESQGKTPQEVIKEMSFDYKSATPSAKLEISNKAKSMGIFKELMTQVEKQPFDPVKKADYQRDLRKEVDGLIKDPKASLSKMKIMDTALDSLEKDLASGKPISAETQAIIFLFNKALDETSAVREGEYARSAEGQAFLSKLEGKWNNIKKGGGGITPEELRDIVETARLFEDGFKNSIINYADRADVEINEYELNREAIFTPDMINLINETRNKKELEGKNVLYGNQERNNIFSKMAFSRMDKMKKDNEIINFVKSGLPIYNEFGDVIFEPTPVQSQIIQEMLSKGATIDEIRSYYNF